MNWSSPITLPTVTTELHGEGLLGSTWHTASFLFEQFLKVVVLLKQAMRRGKRFGGPGKKIPTAQFLVAP